MVALEGQRPTKALHRTAQLLRNFESCKLFRFPL